MEKVFNVSASASDLFSSDLVNGLVLLMNSNISSPVNLVSLSYQAVFDKLKLKNINISRKFSCLSLVDTDGIEVYEICLQGNPEEHTILEFARLIKSLVGKASDLLIFIIIIQYSFFVSPNS